MEKKLPERLEQIVASFATAQPLRLMFQDEARFGRIKATSAIRATAGPNDRCAPWCKRCLRINTPTPTLR